MSDPKSKDKKTDAPVGDAGAKAETAGAVAAAPAGEAQDQRDPALEAALDAIAPPPTVLVTGPEKGRWRIGRKFTREPTSIPVTELTEAQFLALQADPELMVQVVHAPH